MSMRAIAVAAASTAAIAAAGAVGLTVAHRAVPTLTGGPAPARSVARGAAATVAADSQGQPVPGTLTTPGSVRQLPPATTVPGFAAPAAAAPAVAEPVGSLAAPRGSPLPDPHGPASRP